MLINVHKKHFLVYENIRKTNNLFCFFAKFTQLFYLLSDEYKESETYDYNKISKTVNDLFKIQSSETKKLNVLLNYMNFFINFEIAHLFFSKKNYWIIVNNIENVVNILKYYKISKLKINMIKYYFMSIIKSNKIMFKVHKISWSIINKKIIINSLNNIYYNLTKKQLFMFGPMICFEDSINFLIAFKETLNLFNINVDHKITSILNSNLIKYDDSYTINLPYVFLKCIKKL